MIFKNAKKLNNLDYDNYHFFGLWRQDIFAAYFWVKYFNKLFLEEFGFKLPFGGALVLNGGHFFVHKQVLQKIKAFVETDVKNKNYDRYLLFAKKAKSVFLEELLELEKIKITEDKKQLLLDFEKFISIAEKFMVYWCFGYLLGEAFEPILADLSNKEKIPATLITAILPQVDSRLADQQKELFKIKQRLKEKDIFNLISSDRRKLKKIIKEDGDLSKTIKNHLQTFGWIEMISYLGAPLTMDRLFDQLESHNDISHKLPNLKYSDEFKDFLAVTSSVSYVRQAGVEYSSILSFKLYDWLYNVADVIGLTYRNMLNLTPNEILEILEGKITKKDYQARIAERINYNWLIYSDKNEQLIIVSDIVDLKILQEKMVPRASSEDMLVGKIGNKGYAKGRVKIIMGIDDFYKFETGDILVTTMTTPDFVILMQKANAIITDIGGMLSHAAIVSREINTPCLIGTKFATQILKDGMNVEVDANKGVVKILN